MQRVGGVWELKSDALQLSSVIFKVRWPTRRPNYTQTVTKYSKIHHLYYIIDQSVSNFQQGGCLYKSTSGIQWIPDHLWMSDRPETQASAKADTSKFGTPLIISYANNDENCSLP